MNNADLSSQTSKSSQACKSIVVLTGAGISAESGLKTFRANDGLWENHRVEDVATPEAFERDPQLVHRFYNERRQQLLNGTRPNAGHFALAEFEKRYSGDFTLITQNIDNLHEQAGSDNILHMHGELLAIRCATSGQLYPCEEDIRPEQECPCCGLPGQLRPHVVWFGEMPLYMTQIEQTLSKCDLFVAVGTSGNVYPAAGFFQMAKVCGAHTVELNLEPSVSGSLFDEQHYGPGTEVVPEFFARI